MHDPLHSVCAPTTMWSVGNVAEAMPGVPTPLSWSLQGDGVSLGARRGFVDLGVLPSRAPSLDDVDQRVIGIFHGHPVGNVNVILRVVGAMPGTSVRVVLRQVFGVDGEPPPGVVDTARRYPVIAARLPVNAALLARRLRRAEAAARALRRELLPATGDRAASRDALARAWSGFVDTVRLQSFATFLGQGLYEQLARLTAGAGLAGQEARLAAGYGGMEETGVAVGLWEVAHGSRTLQEFLDEHGHHGLGEGELSSCSWREDPAALDATLAALRLQGPDRHPERGLDRQRAQREQLEARLLTALPRRRRPGARALRRLAGHVLPLRESGRSTMHRYFDIARAHARRLGELAAASGDLAEPGDVFYLTYPELTGPWPAGAKRLAAARRERRVHYQGLCVPELFSGTPPETPRSPHDGIRPARLCGQAGAAGVVEGRARVIPELADGGRAEVADGEILVCRVTDPSWVSLMIVAGGLVAEVGSALSHTAIIGRELGIPCVVGVPGACTVIRDGDRVRVDGTNGVVTILEGDR